MGIFPNFKGEIKKIKIVKLLLNPYMVVYIITVDEDKAPVTNDVESILRQVDWCSVACAWTFTDKVTLQNLILIIVHQ